MSWLGRYRKKGAGKSKDNNDGHLPLGQGREVGCRENRHISAKDESG